MSAERKRLYRRRNRLYIEDIKKNNKCEMCGNRDYRVLQFHHLHSKDKAVSRLAVDGSSLKRLKSEIDKCMILCANCHSILHHQPLEEFPDQHCTSARVRSGG